MLLSLIKNCSLDKHRVTQEIERESESISKRGVSEINNISRGDEGSESAQSKKRTSSSSLTNTDLEDSEELSTKVIARNEVLKQIEKKISQAPKGCMNYN